MPFSPSARAGLRSLGGNVTTREITFRVDTVGPSIVIDQPAPSFLLPTATPFVSISYRDAQDVDTATLKILVDGVDRTSHFPVLPGVATATLDPIAEGAHTISPRPLSWPTPRLLRPRSRLPSMVLSPTIRHPTL